MALRRPMCLICSVGFTLLQLNATRHRHIVCARRSSKRHDGRENNKINRLDKLATALATAAAVVGGPYTRNHQWRQRDVASGGEDHRWWSTYTSLVGRQRGLQHLLINTDACFDACVSQGSSRTVRNRPVLGRVIRRADTVALWPHTLHRCVATDAAYCLALPGS